MAEQILYILGAGASSKAIPLSKTIEIKPKTILGLIDSMKQFPASYVKGSGVLSSGLYSSFRVGFNELAQAAEPFGDIDTYAKYLFLRGMTSEFQNLKFTLSAYLTVLQTVLNKKDSRYIPWLVSIMSENRFPNNVQILSWNYDYQVELASRKVTESHEWSKHDKRPYKDNILSHYPNELDSLIQPKPYSIVHLNGTAGLCNVKSEKYPELNDITTNILNPDILSDDDKIYDFLACAENHKIKFAWEQRPSEISKEIELAIANIIPPTIVVVIGYSFPFYNRDIDKYIFNQLIKEKVCRKIYYQDPILTGQQLIGQFGLKEILKENIVHISNTNNFHIPFEY